MQMPLNDERGDAFKAAVQAFNTQAFYPCHEIIEDELWRPMAEGPDKTFLQGWLQVAVGLLHRERGNYTGAKNLLTAGLEKLRATQEQTGFRKRLDLPRLIQDSQTALQAVLALGPERIDAFPPDQIPCIHPLPPPESR